jgi:hypothetical protein
MLSFGTFRESAFCFFLTRNSLPTPVAPEIGWAQKSLIKLNPGFYRYDHKYMK